MTLKTSKQLKAQKIPLNERTIIEQNRKHNLNNNMENIFKGKHTY